MQLQGRLYKASLPGIEKVMIFYMRHDISIRDQTMDKDDQSKLYHQMNLGTGPGQQGESVPGSLQHEKEKDKNEKGRTTSRASRAAALGERDSLPPATAGPGGLSCGLS